MKDAKSGRHPVDNPFGTKVLPMSQVQIVTYVSGSDKKSLVHLGGVSSNTLFDILAKWNEVLKSLENPANDPERDICGVVG